MRKAVGLLFCMTLVGCDLKFSMPDFKGIGGLPAVVTEVTLDRTSFSINVLPPTGDPDPTFVVSEKLTARVRPSSANQEVTWTSSHPERITISPDGTVSATPGGVEETVTITVASKADPTKTATASVHLTTDSHLDMEVD